MRGSDLSAAQLSRLRQQAAAKLDWINRLVERMSKSGWEATDDLHQAAMHAQAALHHLHERTLYTRSKHGAAKAAEGGWPEDIVRRA
jgi:hypothetical protein